MKVLLLTLLLVFSFGCNANQDLNKYWHWNMIAVDMFPGGQTINEISKNKPSNLQGAATVEIEGDRINIMIHSAYWSEEPVKISGILSNSKIEEAIVYREDRVDGDYGLIGEYRKKVYTEKCTFEEIVLKSYNPDAEVHLLARSSSTCSQIEIENYYKKQGIEVRDAHDF